MQHSVSKDPPTKSPMVLLKPHRQGRNYLGSPCSSSVNALLQDINLPKTRFDTILIALGPPGNQDDNSADGLDNPCNLSPPPLDKNLSSHLESPQCVDMHNNATLPPNAIPMAEEPTDQLPSMPDPRTLDKGVRINKSPTTIAPAARFHPASNTRSTGTLSELAPNPAREHTPHSNHPREIHDWDNRLLCVLSKDGAKELCYYVEDFVGLYPAWPIIKFCMAPTGNTKDKWMTSFSKCVVGLLRELLYVDDMAKIAPLLITNNDPASFIASKANLPTNFTKLGKYIMISGSSWVFSKKEKGSNNVFAHFRLKSQVETEEIINRISFEFSRLGGKNLYKKQHQAMEMETPVMLLFICNGTNQGSIKSDTWQMLETALDNIEQNGARRIREQGHPILHAEGKCPASAIRIKTEHHQIL